MPGNSPLLMAGVVGGLSSVLLGATLTQTPAVPPCPRCGNKHAVERQKRPFLVKKILFFLPLRYFQCQSCRKRFYRFG